MIVSYLLSLRMPSKPIPFFLFTMPYNLSPISILPSHCPYSGHTLFLCQPLVNLSLLTPLGTSSVLTHLSLFRNALLPCFMPCMPCQISYLFYSYHLPIHMLLNRAGESAVTMRLKTVYYLFLTGPLPQQGNPFMPPKLICNPTFHSDYFKPCLLKPPAALFFSQPLS